MGEVRPFIPNLIELSERLPVLARLFQTSMKGPLLVRYSLPQWEDSKISDYGGRVEEEKAFRVQLMAKVGCTPLRQLEQEIAEWCFRRPLLIPGTNVAIRPFWRDRVAVAPPLPMSGKSGRIYKHGQRIPLSEAY